MVANKLLTLEGDELDWIIDLRISVASLYDPFENRYLAETYFLLGLLGSFFNNLLASSTLPCEYRNSTWRSANQYDNCLDFTELKSIYRRHLYEILEILFFK